jgi:hypothetical protein
MLSKNILMETKVMTAKVWSNWDTHLHENNITETDVLLLMVITLEVSQCM